MSFDEYYEQLICGYCFRLTDELFEVKDNDLSNQDREFPESQGDNS